MSETLILLPAYSQSANFSEELIRLKNCDMLKALHIHEAMYGVDVPRGGINCYVVKGGYNSVTNTDVGRMKSLLAGDGKI